MQEQEGAHNLVFLENDVAEATFPDDSSDIKEEPDTKKITGEKQRRSLPDLHFKFCESCR